MAEGSRRVTGAEGTVEAAAAAPRRIGLVEDHESVALGLSAMLAPEADLELVATAQTVRALLDQTDNLDLAVLDLRLPDGSSPEDNVRLLREHGIETLVFTGAEN